MSRDTTLAGSTLKPFAKLSPWAGVRAVTSHALKSLPCVIPEGFFYLGHDTKMFLWKIYVISVLLLILTMGNQPSPTG